MSDVIIIGAGAVGLSCASSLSSLGLEIVLIEKQDEIQLSNPAYDGREIALTHLSKQLLEKTGAWHHLDPDSISFVKEAKVLDGGSSYSLDFDYREVCEDTLGFMVSNHRIRKALYQEVKTRSNIRLICNQSIDHIRTTHSNAEIKLNDGRVLSSGLIIASDGRFSTSRTAMGISTKMYDFGKTAIVCKVSHELPHQDTAYECFRYGNTLAVLPLSGNNSSIVMTIPSDQKTDILDLTDKELGEMITVQFKGLVENHFGDMEIASQRFSYPLIASYANRFFANRFAIIGDAAVSMHPVTAHGYNFGLKGQYLLSEEIKKARYVGNDIGSLSILKEYDRTYKRASKPLYLATNALVKLYTNEHPFPKVLRKAVLRLGNVLPPAKRAIMHQLTEIKHFT